MSDAFTYWHWPTCTSGADCRFVRIAVSDREGKRRAAAAGWERLTYRAANRHTFQSEDYPDFYAAPVVDAAWFA